MHDLAIMNGTIVDGTGGGRFASNVYVRDGRIAKVSTEREAAREEIDATGLIVSPGFLDVHTHYDAQAFWDPTLSPSSFNGVTTVFGGLLGPAGRWLYHRTSSNSHAAFARLGLAERIALTKPDFVFAGMKGVIAGYLAAGRGARA